MEAGKLTLDPHRFSLDRLLRDVGAILSANLGNKDIEVLYRVEPDTPMWLEGDALRLQQVLINLAGNAIKFTERGKVLLLLEPAGTLPERGELRIGIHDTGPGMSPEYLARVFDPFSQADDSITRQHGGTGLGTTIARDLVALMNGRIDIDSTVGVGTRVDIRLPLPGALRQLDALPEQIGRAHV